MYVTQGLDQPGAVAALAATSYDMIVVDPTATVKGDANFDMSGMVSELHAGHPGRVVLAYLNIGEAASYRTYWKGGWRAPSGHQPGNPNFILSSDPNGWSAVYPVAYWNKTWQNLLVTGRNSVVKQLMNAGFDGVQLDWVEGYSDPTVDALASRRGIDPAKAMVDLISRIRSVVQSVNPHAYVVALNADNLIDDDPRFAQVIDGITFEDTWYSGNANAPWADPAGGDVPTDPSTTQRRVEQYAKYQAAGKTVFTLDYSLDPDHAAAVYDQSSALGFVPLVTQVSLSQISTTPPPSLG